MHQSPSLFSKVRGSRPVYYTHPLIKSKHVLLFFSLQYQMSFQIMSMHAEASLFSTFLCIIKSFQIPSESTIYRSCIIIFLWSSKSIQIPSTGIHEAFTVPVFFSFFCDDKSFQIPSECTIYRPCFHFFLCSSKSFQMPSRVHHLPSLFFQEGYPLPHIPPCLVKNMYYFSHCSFVQMVSKYKR